MCVVRVFSFNIKQQIVWIIDLQFTCYAVDELVY